MHSLMYNNAEPFQWLQDIYWHWIFFLRFRIDFRPIVCYLEFRWVFHTLIFVSFQHITNFFILLLWFLIYALYSAFQLKTQEIDKSK